MHRDERRHLAYQVQRLLRAGRSRREVAAGLGIARRTVGRLLKELEQRRAAGEHALAREVTPRTPKPSMLDPFVPKILEWLDEYPDLTAVRCYEKLQGEGFAGRYTIVRERFKELRRERVPPRPTATPVETAPGQRMEFDWSPYTLANGQKINVWSAHLRWSRASSLATETNTRQTTIFRRLRASFEEWGGVPDEGMTDSMPGVVDRWECDEPVLNGRYVDCVAYYGYTSLIAPRGCPQWKAGVERRYLFHEKNLLNGRTFHSVAEHREALAWWVREKALARKHPEDSRSIREMLDLERVHLKPLPARPYDTRDVFVRVVDDYQRVQLETNHYPVPAPVGALVYLCADAERIEICDNRASRLIEHERLPDGAKIKLPPAHVHRVRYDIDELCERLAGWGEVAGAFAQRLRKARRYAGPELVRLLQLQVEWSRDDLVAAMEHAASYCCFDVEKVQRILALHYSPRRFEDQIADATRERIQDVMSAHPVGLRPLDSYEALRTGDRPLGPPEEAAEQEQEQEEDDDVVDPSQP